MASVALPRQSVTSGDGSLCYCAGAIESAHPRLSNPRKGGSKNPGRASLPRPHRLPLLCRKHPGNPQTTLPTQLLFPRHHSARHPRILSVVPQAGTNTGKLTGRNTAKRSQGTRNAPHTVLTTVDLLIAVYLVILFPKLGSVLAAERYVNHQAES